MSKNRRAHEERDPVKIVGGLVLLAVLRIFIPHMVTGMIAADKVQSHWCISASIVSLEENCLRMTTPRTGPLVGARQCRIRREIGI
jgi:hypothetical protein